MWCVLRDWYVDIASHVSWKGDISRVFSELQGIHQGGIHSVEQYKAHTNDSLKLLEEQNCDIFTCRQLSHMLFIKIIKVQNHQTLLGRGLRWAHSSWSYNAHTNSNLCMMQYTILYRCPYPSYIFQTPLFIAIIQVNDMSHMFRPGAV